MVILVTGMSGMEIFKCLENFRRDYKPFTNEKKHLVPELIKFDTEIENIFYEQNPTVVRNNQVWKGQILTKTYFELESLWNKAFEKVYAKVKNIEASDQRKPIIINLHSCYFHNRTQEFLSIANLESIRTLNPQKIITLIDDIYEIHHRLTLPGGIYQDDTNPSPTEIILRYLRLLDWRAKETILSRQLAKFLQRKNYLFAIKHSYESFFNLLFDAYPKAYVSHPISEVRRLIKNNETAMASKIMSEITDLSDRVSSNFTAFLPTTIDEYRIHFEERIKETKEGIIKKKLYSPILTERWESSHYANDTKEILYKRPQEGDPEKNRLWKKKKLKKANQLCELLSGLADFISDQVSVRDYTLVEQSDLMVIYRPLFNGNASGGVLEEFNYYVNLKKVSNNKVKCFIYCPSEDVDNFYVRQFEERVELELSLKKLRIKGRKKYVSLTEEEKKRLLLANSNKDLILDVLQDVFFRAKITFAVENAKTPLSTNKITQYKSNFVDALMKDRLVLDAYKDGTEFMSQKMTVPEFVDTINQTLNI